MTTVTPSGNDSYADYVATQSRRFLLGCLLNLAPPARRAGALTELLDADPDFFRIGHDHPSAVLDSACADGTPEVRVALARSVRDERVQQRLLALDDPAVDAALADNPTLGWVVERPLRLRRPQVIAAGGGYQAAHHRRALLDIDAELVAGALLDRRVRRYEPPVPVTVWAAAWRAVRLADGPDRVRRLLAALPPGAELDDATTRIAEACAEAGPGVDPSPFLSSAEEHLTGTEALLRRVRELQGGSGRSRWSALEEEPYQVDWALVGAAGLGWGRRLTRQGRRWLAARPGCPPDVAHILRTGRPAPPGLLPQPAAASEPALSAPAPPAAGCSVPACPGPAPRQRGPLQAGRLEREDPLVVLQGTALGGSAPMDAELTVWHLWSALEWGLLDPAAAASTAWPASTLVCHAGQASAYHAHLHRPGSGEDALTGATIALLAQELGDPPPPGFWAHLAALIRPFAGTLPELLSESALRARRSHPGR